MAVFSLEIADGDVARVLSAVAANYKRPEKVSNPDFDLAQPVDGNNPEMIDNPETVAQFTNRIVRQFLAEHVSSYEKNIARQAAIEGINTSITISDPEL